MRRRVGGLGRVRQGVVCSKLGDRTTAFQEVIPRHQSTIRGERLVAVTSRLELQGYGVGEIQIRAGSDLHLIAAGAGSLTCKRKRLFLVYGGI